jgi:HTH-type transcriptional regulator/antitoxin HipB
MDANYEMMKRLGQAVKDRRKKLSITQEALGSLADCGALFVLELEQGKPTIRVDKLLSVLTVLNLQLKLTEGNHGIVTD